MSCIRLIDLSMLNHPCDTAMNLTWSWCMLFFMCCWIWFVIHIHFLSIQCCYEYICLIFLNIMTHVFHHGAFDSERSLEHLKPFLLFHLKCKVDFNSTNPTSEAYHCCFRRSVDLSYAYWLCFFFYELSVHITCLCFYKVVRVYLLIFKHYFYIEVISPWSVMCCQ